MEQLIYTCTQCDKLHEGLPAITFRAPTLYSSIPEAERGERALLSSDFCVVDNEHYFVRTVLVVPVKGYSETLEWGVWGSLSRDNFVRYFESFDDGDQAELGPLFSYFANSLRGFPNTLALKTSLHPQDGRRRPTVEFHRDEMHAIAVAQREGVPVDRAISLVAPLLHRH